MGDLSMDPLEREAQDHYLGFNLTGHFGKPATAVACYIAGHQSAERKSAARDARIADWKARAIKAEADKEFLLLCRDKSDARIAQLEAELAKEIECVDWYADGRNWHSIDDLYSYNRRDIVDKSDVDLARPFNAGKRARARQKERADILDQTSVKSDD